MNWHFNLSSDVMLLSGAILLILVYLLSKKKNVLSAEYLKRMLTAAVFWSVINGLELASNDASLKVLFSKIEYIGVTSIIPLWFMFVLSYTKKEEFLSVKLHTFFISVSLAVTALVFTNEYHRLVWPEITPVRSAGGLLLNYSHGPVLYIFAAYCAVILVTGLVILFSSLRITPSLFRWQVWLVISGSLVPWIGNSFYIAGYSPLPSVDPTPIGFIFTGAAFLYAIARYKMFDLMPVARDTLFDKLMDGVIVLDEKRRIADINSSATGLTGVNLSKAVGRHISGILEPLAEVLQNSNDIGDAGNQYMDMHDRTIEVSFSPLRDRKRNICGHLVFFAGYHGQAQG